MFQEEFEYFRLNQAELVEKYKGKILVLKGKSILGAYDSTLEALYESVKENEIGSFMIQPCQPGPEAYTVTISTLGLFV
jgi:hypothetical protein